MADEQNGNEQWPWQCPHCETVNEDHVYKCAKCDRSKPYLWAQPSTSLTPDEDNTECVPTCSGAAAAVAPVDAVLGAHSSLPHIHVLNDSPDERLDFPVNECRLVLLGKTGGGKSSSANTIVGFQRFEVGRSFQSTTARCWWHEVRRFGVNLEVVDTPGFFDTSLDDAVVTKEIVKCIGVVAPGPHALLIVIRIDAKFTDEEARTVDQIRSLFGADVMRHIIIVFTHGDVLEGQHINERLRTSTPELRRLLEETERRFVVFNNKEKDEARNAEQVRKLLVTVRGLLASSHDKHFSSPFLRRCQEAVKASTENLSAMLEESCTSDKLRELIRMALMERDNTEKMLHEVMSNQEKDAKEQQEEFAKKNREIESAKENIERLKDEKIKAEKISREEKEKIRNLNQELEEFKKLREHLERELQEEKKKIKCRVL